MIVTCTSSKGASTELTVAVSTFERLGLSPAQCHATSWLFDEPSDAMCATAVSSFYELHQFSPALLPIFYITTTPQYLLSMMVDDVSGPSRAYHHFS